MSIKTFKVNNQQVKVKALKKMLSDDYNPHAVQHFTREMQTLFNTGAGHSVPKDFVKNALLAGQFVVLFNTSSWLICSNGSEDVDFLVLKHEGSYIEYFCAKAGDTSDNHAGYVPASYMEYEDLIRAIVSDYSQYSRAGTTGSNCLALAFSNELVYAPDWSIDSLPSGWELVSQPVPTGNKHKTVTNSTTQENKTMSNVKTTATAVAAKNKSAAVTVAKLEAGRIAIKQVSRVVTPKLPMMIRGYADSEIGRLVMANLFNFAVTQFAPNNANAQVVADAMLEGAMLEMLQKFNFEEMINEVVSKVDINKLTSAE